MIDRAAAGDAPAVAELIAEAFGALDVVSWLVPDRAERHEVLTGDFRILVDHALDHGEVHFAGDGDAAAVWLPSTAPPPDPVGYDERLVAACGRWVDRFRALDALFAANHPSDPHHYLALLAVRPMRQGQGLGSALLRHQHQRLDAEGRAAYLEASGERSRDLYLRHGYRVSEPFRTPDGSPFWPMWRPAQP